MSHVGARRKGEEMVHFPSSELPSGFPAFPAPPSVPSNPTLTQSPVSFFLRRLQSSDPLAWGGVQVSVQGGEQGQERGWPLSIHILSVTKTRKHAEVQSHHPPHPMVSLDDGKWLQQVHGGLKSPSKRPEKQAVHGEAMSLRWQISMGSDGDGLPGGSQVGRQEASTSVGIIRTPSNLPIPTII